MIDIRLTHYEVRSPFYFIYSSASDFRIDAPFPARMNVIPNPFLWMDWVMVIFMLALIGYYRCIISEKTTKVIGWLSMGPGVVTFFVNLLSLLHGIDYLIIAVPIPLPSIIGLVILKVYPCELTNPWPEGREAEAPDTAR